ncbi:hypothetical protein HMF7854_07540 [Sphingomonas ginkgonis]|uniref:Parvulin-like PPIase n=1 Tax=Sphingomonas ginkgonis TaxID=2315330 RepID=A0A429V9P7_9SPHN|nr:peptidylprolyl isomerase [Sphingomonas ginkgonis]RST30701.1 hypothetical protein HMF7854_07540 [Sphingomonas ginkgonis]
MLTTLRRVSNSKGGQFIFAILLVTMLAAWGLADVTSIQSGGGFSWFGGGGGVAKVGSTSLTQADIDRALERRLQQVRQQNPNATYATIAGDYDAIIEALLQDKTVQAMGDKADLDVSRKLVDAEIAQIPGLNGLDGKFSEQNYQQFLSRERLTDQQVRDEIRTALLQRMIVVPTAASARVPTGQALPYASLMLELRQGEVGFIPTKAFEAGIAPTPAAVQAYYTQNRARYLVPEQRVLRIARIGPDQLPNVNPTDQEIAAAYQANQAQYAAKETRGISRAVVADKVQADAIAAKVRSGTPFAAAAAPAGLAAADIALGDQTRDALANLTNAQVAAAAFAAPSGGVVGPIRTELGWVVVKVDGIKRQAGKTLDEARPEIAAKLRADKAKDGLADLVGTVEDELSNGANFTETVAKHKLPVSETPPLLANGQSRTQPGFRLPAELQPVLKEGFALSPDDDPTAVNLQGDAGYALVALGPVTAAQPAPLAQIGDQVRADLVRQGALDKARSSAQAIAARVGNGSIAAAVKTLGVPVPAPAPVTARRIQLLQLQGNVPPALRMLFSLPAGKTQYVAAPNDEGFFLVKADRVVAGDARTNPSVIAQQQAQLNQQAGSELAEQFIRAAQKSLGTRRNADAIAQGRQRLLTSGQ